jgi:hypothetical protein
MDIENEAFKTGRAQGIDERRKISGIFKDAINYAR